MRSIEEKQSVMHNQSSEEQIATALIHQASAMIETVNMQGHTPFKESAKVGMVRMQMYALIPGMQLLGILPMDLHIKDGQLIRHEEENRASDCSKGKDDER